MTVSTYLGARIDDTFNNGGSTFDRAGRTVNVTDEHGPRYVVGGAVPTPMFRADGDRDALISQMAAFIARTHARYFGTWLHKEHIYVDAVDIVSTEAEAIILGSKRGEIAIFDLFTMSEITL